MASIKKDDLARAKTPRVETREHGTLITHGISSANFINDNNKNYFSYSETGPYYAVVLKVFDDDTPPPSGSVAAKLRTTIGLFGDLKYPKLIKARVLERFHSILEEPEIGQLPAFQNAPISTNQNTNSFQAAPIQGAAPISQTPNTNVWEVESTTNTVVYKPRNKSSGPVLYIFPGTDAPGRQDPLTGASAGLAVQKRLIDQMANFGAVVIFNVQNGPFDSGRTQALGVLSNKGYTVTDKYLFGFSGGGSGINQSLTKEPWKKVFCVDAIALASTPTNTQNIEVIFSSDNWSQGDVLIQNIITGASIIQERGGSTKEIKGIRHYDFITRSFYSIVNTLNNPTVLNADIYTSAEPSPQPAQPATSASPSTSGTKPTAKSNSGFGAESTQTGSESATETSAENASSSHLSAWDNFRSGVSDFTARTNAGILALGSAAGALVSGAGLDGAEDVLEQQYLSTLAVNRKNLGLDPNGNVTNDSDSQGSIGAASAGGSGVTSNQVNGPLTARDEVFINMHDTFVAFTDRAQEANLVVGSVVVVDYMDRKNKTEPVFLDVCVGNEGLVQTIGKLVKQLRDGFSSSPQSVQGSNPSSPQLTRRCGKGAEPGPAGKLPLVDCEQIPDEYVKPAERPKFLHPLAIPKLIEFLNYYNDENNTEPVIVAYKKDKRKTYKDWKLLVSSGKRTIAEQQGLRRKHCPLVRQDEAKYMNDRSVFCDPQTGVPGNSNHQPGEAVDFNMNEKRCGSKPKKPANKSESDFKKSAEYQAYYELNKVCIEHYEFMKKKMLEYGFKNYAEENWHYDYIGTGGNS